LQQSSFSIIAVSAYFSQNTRWYSVLPTSTGSTGVLHRHPGRGPVSGQAAGRQRCPCVAVLPRFDAEPEEILDYPVGEIQ
jgi:hypothetical protein